MKATAVQDIPRRSPYAIMLMICALVPASAGLADTTPPGPLSHTNQDYVPVPTLKDLLGPLGHTNQDHAAPPGEQQAPPRSAGGFGGSMFSLTTMPGSAGDRGNRVPVMFDDDELLSSVRGAFLSPRPSALNDDLLPRPAAPVLLPPASGEDTGFPGNGSDPGTGTSAGPATQPIPAPGSLILIGAGLLAASRRRRIG